VDVRDGGVLDAAHDAETVTRAGPVANGAIVGAREQLSERRPAHRTNDVFVCTSARGSG
jgi:hypothetical protein